MIQKLLVAAASVAMLFCVSLASAQDCGCNNAAPGGWLGGARHANMYGYWYGHNRHAQNCGRVITNDEAASLWANYCYDDCSYQGGSGCGTSAGCGAGAGCGHGCNLLGLFKNRRNLGSFAGCGCDRGCFGWPTACGGCNDGCGGGGFGHGCGSGGGLLSALKSRLHGGGFANSSGCNSGCGSACDTGCNSGCGFKLGGRFFGGSGAGLGHGGFLHRLFHHRCGARNAYFNEFTGPDYGDCDIKSCVNGSLTNACGCNGAMNVNQGNQQMAPTPAPATPAVAPEKKMDLGNSNELQGELLDN